MIHENKIIDVCEIKARMLHRRETDQFFVFVSE